MNLDAVTRSIESTKRTDFFDVTFDADNDTVVAVGAEGVIRTSRRDSPGLDAQTERDRAAISTQSPSEATGRPSLQWETGARFSSPVSSEGSGRAAQVDTGKRLQRCRLREQCLREHRRRGRRRRHHTGLRR